MQALEKIDISLESRIVANLVSDTHLLEQCCEIVDPTLFESPTTQIIVEWTLDYFRRQHEAPGKNLKDVYIARRDELNEGTQNLVLAYMKRGDWLPNGNTEFAKKQLTEYLQVRSMTRLVDRLKVSVERGSVKDCEKAIADWQKPELYQSKLIDFFKDVKGVQEAISKDEEDCLFRFDKDLGGTVGNFVQSDYVLWLAPAKRGKTWWLMYTALQAAMQGNKVLYISLEMDEDETRERFARMLAGKSKYGEVSTVTRFHLCGEDRYEMLQEEINTKPMDISTKSVKKMLTTAEKYSQGGDLRFMVFPTNSFTVEDLERELKNMEVYNNYIPTVVVIDYVDIMKFQYGNEKRFGLDKLHLDLRSLNMSRKFCLVSASQAGRQNVTGENDVTEADIAECAAKLNHATKIILINQTRDEKKIGVYRINVNMSRHGGVSYETCVVASCLDIGRPCIDCHRLSTIYDPRQERNEESGYGRRKNSYAE